VREQLATLWVGVEPGILSVNDTKYIILQRKVSHSVKIATVKKSVVGEGCLTCSCCSKEAFVKEICTHARTHERTHTG